MRGIFNSHQKCMHVQILARMCAPFEFQVLLWMNLWTGCYKLALTLCISTLLSWQPRASLADCLLTEHAKQKFERKGRRKFLYDQGRCIELESSVHAAISLLVAISNAMHNGDKLLQTLDV